MVGGLIAGSFTRTHFFFYIVAAAKYVLVSQGRCPMGTELNSLSACSAAAAYLKLADTSASSYSSSSSYYRRRYPPFCYYEGGQLRFNSGSHYGSCSSSRQCLCAKDEYFGVL